jgi:DNA-binding HxlR family transcriptional regulator
VNDKAKPAIDPGLILNSQVAQALTVIGDRWAFMVIRDVYLGVRQFEELRRRGNAARGTLASRLKKLVQHGVLYKNPYQTSPIRYEYRLTDKGLDLYPVVLTMWQWEMTWGQGRFLPPELVHKRCGNTVLPVFRCSECHAGVVPQDVEFSPGRRANSAKKVPARYQRRSRIRSETGAEESAFTLFSIIGDRWTSLVIAAAFFGMQRFDDIASSIGIATNILADRLKLLVETGVLVRRPYHERPARFEYHLSDKGRDLYAITIAMHEWADRWLIDKDKKPLLLRHSPCDKPFKSELVCSACEEALRPADVSFNRERRRRKAG